MAYNLSALLEMDGEECAYMSRSDVSMPLNDGREVTLR